MYKLERVYATISFERNKINLLVVEYSTEHKVNCLYYNSINHDYLDGNISFVNHDTLVAKLRSLISAADNFLGINIKRYIVNISCLPIKSSEGRSPESLVFETLTEDHANNYVEKILFATRDENQYSLKIYPTGWYLDGQYSPNFPEGSIGRKISFDYISLIVSRRIVDQFVDLITQIGGRVLNVVCNSLCLGALTNEVGIDNVVVDIKTTSTVINLYNKHGDIKAIHTLPRGSNWYFNEIKQLLGIPESTNIKPMIEALDILTNVDEDIVLLHKHRSEFLTIQEATVNSLLSALKIVSKRLFKEIDGELAKLRDKRRSNFTKVYLNLIGTLTQPFAKACPRSTIDNIPIEIITNNVVGLEDYAINNMLAAVAYVHNTQTNTKEHHTYSVDPYISQRASNYQFKQNLWIKLGVISTKWAAKLGD